MNVIVIDIAAIPTLSRIDPDKEDAIHMEICALRPRSPRAVDHDFIVVNHTVSGNCGSRIHVYWPGKISEVVVVNPIIIGSCSGGEINQRMAPGGGKIVNQHISAATFPRDSPGIPRSLCLVVIRGRGPLINVENQQIAYFYVTSTSPAVAEKNPTCTLLRNRTTTGEAGTRRAFAEVLYSSSAGLIGGASGSGTARSSPVNDPIASAAEVYGPS